MAKMGIKKSKKTVQIGPNITITEKQHDNLLQYIKDRLDFGRGGRDDLIDRYRQIDREFYGSLWLDPEDRKRQRDNLRAKGSQTTDFILQMVQAKLDEALSYLMSVLADDDMYSAIAPENMQEAADAFTLLLQKHYDDFKHYPHLFKGMLDMYKYNFGGWAPIEWETVVGSKISRSTTGGIAIEEDQVVQSGNSVTAIDPYNFLYDISVDPTELNIKGEFFAIPELHIPYRVLKMAQNGEIYGTDRFITKDKKVVDSLIGTAMYYEAKPDIFIDGMLKVSGMSNWKNLWTGGTSKDVGKKIEFVNTYIDLVPKDFGLSDGNKYEIWRITQLQDKYIIAAERHTNAHGMLPCAIATPRFDGFGQQAKSSAESLMPLQRFASNEMNVRQKAARKKLYGVTVYDQTQIPLFEQADVLGGKVPWAPSSKDADIRKAIMQFSDVPQTDDTLQNVQVTSDLMEGILPTDMLRQVSSLERATQFQAAATVHAANRRPLKDAKLINAMALVDLKKIQVYNVFQYQEVVEIYDDQQRRFVEINPTVFNDMNMEWFIASGIKGLDKLIYTEMIREMVNGVLQSQAAIQEIDIVKLLDFYVDLIGAKVNFNSFRYETPFDQLSQEQKTQAFQLLQRASAAAAEVGGQGNVAALPARGVQQP